MADTRPTISFLRSDGKQFEIDGKTFDLLHIDGIGAPKVELYTEKRAVGDGDIVTGRRIAARTINIEASNKLQNLNPQMRKLAGAFFNPRYRFDVTVQYMGVERTAAGCLIKAIDMPTGNIHRKLRLNLTFFCEDAYMLGEGLRGQNINSVRNGFGFPFVSLVGVGFNYAVFEFTANIAIENDGDAPTYVRAIFTARGNVNNPKLVKDGAYIRVLKTLVAGDVLEIDTEQNTVKLNGENAVNLVDKTSDFAAMELAIGDNTIGFGADSGDNLLDVAVFYSKRYQGV